MKKILVKLSGEGLSTKENIFDKKIIDQTAKQLVTLSKKGYSVSVVVGGGNIWRGAENNYIQRNRADYIGMMATTINSLVLQSAIEKNGADSITLNSFFIDERICEYYTVEKANKYLKEGKIVIFSGGIGRPYFSTDSNAAQISSELKIKTILMGKNGVDGVYDMDPSLNKKAKRFDNLTYDDLINKNLKVMDQTAVIISKNSNIEILVFNINENDSLNKVLNNEILNTNIK
ncbi:MAG: UMP kinase [Mollicutes bacterium PWAP]|nr:UMP kinase [Mollicutes bacterium PWAP]